MNAVGNTATTALSTVSGAAILQWLMNCVSQGHMIAPDQPTLLAIAGVMAPIFHGLYLAIVNRLARVAGEASPPVVQLASVPATPAAVTNNTVVNGE